MNRKALQDAIVDLIDGAPTAEARIAALDLIVSTALELRKGTENFIAEQAALRAARTK